jgi:hypothetical protein
MKKQQAVFTAPTLPAMVCVLVLFSSKTDAAWNGIGVSTGTGGSDICDTANWTQNVVDGDFSTIDTAGIYTLTMSSDMDRTKGATATGGEQFKFGCLVDGVQLTIVSDAEGTPRILTSGGVFRMGVVTPTATNTVTFSKDIRLEVVSSLVIAQGATLSGTLLPAFTVDGPLALGAPLKHTGGVLTLNGPVSGPGSLTIGGNPGTTAYTTLTCATNTFSGGIFADVTAKAHLTATAATVLANQGEPFALGSGGAICFPSNTVANCGIALSGFSTPQTTDRVFVLTATFSYLFNNGAAPLRLTGAITNTASAGMNCLYLSGTYNSHASPNVIGGPIIQQSPSHAITPRIVGNGLWKLTNSANTFTGEIRMGGDNMPDEGLQFLSASALGLNPILFLSHPLNAANNYFTFLGDADCTVGKDIDIEGYYHQAVNNLIANGDGKITLSGTFFLTTLYNSSPASRGLAFGGTGEGLYTGTSWLTNRFNNQLTFSIDLLKRGSGSWRFAGEHLNHEGNTRIDAGSLIFDYTNHNQMTAPTNKMTLNEGKLTFRGAAGGTTEESINSLQLSERNFQFNTLALDANGGSGVHLTLETLAAPAGAPATCLSHLFDLASAPGNALTVDRLTNLSVVKGMLMRGNRAVFLIRHAGGVSFATWDAAGKQIVPFTAYDTYTGTPGGAGGNYLFTSDITRSSSLYFVTVTADSSASGVTVDIGGGRFYLPTDEGRAVLARGTHDVTFRTANAEEGARVTWFHNYLTDNAALKLDLSLTTTNQWYTDGSGALTFTGPGLTVVTKAGLGTAPTLAQGVLRLTQPQTLAPTVGLTLADGGILEIGADLNGAAAGDLSLPCGAVPGGIVFLSGSGISAHGTDRVVNLGGAGATLSWGANGFQTSASFEDHGFAFKLSSPRADATVDFQNPIALNAYNSPYGFRRTVEVENGSAEVDALLSGAISGDSELVKTGAGTLKVSAAQAYSALRIKAGRFIAADGCFAAGNAIPVTLASATLGGTAGSHNHFGALILTGDCELDTTDGTAAMSFADCSQTDWGGATLAVRGKPRDNTLRFGTSGTGLTAAQLAAITVPNATVRMADDGYVRILPKGTLFTVR